MPCRMKRWPNNQLKVSNHCIFPLEVPAQKLVKALVAFLETFSELRFHSRMHGASLVLVLHTFCSSIASM